jgi:hypothetical protein
VDWRKSAIPSRFCDRQADGGRRFIEAPPVLTGVDGATREKITAALVEYAETVL